MSKLKGLADVQRNFDRLFREIDGKVTPQAIKDVANDLLGKAVLAAPIDTGDLRGSGFVEIDEKGDQVTATIGFAGLPYAVVQHENMEFKHPQGGGPKYLERPFVENSDKYIKHLRDSVKKAVD